MRCSSAARATPLSPEVSRCTPGGVAGCSTLAPVWAPPSGLLPSEPAGGAFDAPRCPQCHAANAERIAPIARARIAPSSGLEGVHESLEVELLEEDQALT